MRQGNDNLSTWKKCDKVKEKNNRNEVADGTGKFVLYVLVQKPSCFPPIDIEISWKEKTPGNTTYGDNE